MKRSRGTHTSLVYAYGCGRPLSGWEHAEREAERMADMWDRLVMVDQNYEEAQEKACAHDDPEAAQLLIDIERIDAEIKAARAAGAEKKNLDALHDAKRSARRALVQSIADWRKNNRNAMLEIERRRLEAVAEVRRLFTVASKDPLYWCNSDEIIQRYDTARKAVRQFGRKLRQHDLSREDGCLVVRIIRTRSGLGAAPQELMDGTFAHFQMGRIDPGVYRHPHPPARLYRTMVEMRVDADGHMVRIPVWMHRPLPEDGRIKQVRLVWRKDGDRLRYSLCFTVNFPKTVRTHPSVHTAHVRIAPRIDWRPSEHHPEHPRARIAVAEISGSDGHNETLFLPEEWVREMDRVDHLPSVISDETPPEHLRRYWARQRPGLWRRLLLRRREIYRLFARRIAVRYGRIVIETPPLAVQAFIERGQQQNAVRHRACAHQLISELKHQAGKSGAIIETVIVAPTASAAVPLRIRGRKNSGLQNHDAQKTAALANSAAGP